MSSSKNIFFTNKYVANCQSREYRLCCYKNNPQNLSGMEQQIFISSSDSISNAGLRVGPSLSGDFGTQGIRVSILASARVTAESGIGNVTITLSVPLLTVSAQKQWLLILTSFNWPRQVTKSH